MRKKVTRSKGQGTRGKGQGTRGEGRGAASLRPCPRSGQAMVEFIVALISVITIFAVMVQLAAFGRAQTDTMVNARRTAGLRSLLEPPAQTSADYIQDWDPGDDESRHTADDFYRRANPAAFQSDILDRTVASPADWAVLDAVPDNPISGLRGASNPSARFGLVNGTDSETIPLLPAVRHLIYRSDRITIESDVWMASTTGIY